jgi:hypothetical protein
MNAQARARDKRHRRSMQGPGHIGIDLHRKRFTCCLRLEDGRNYLSDWKLEDLPRFISGEGSVAGGADEG